MSESPLHTDSSLLLRIAGGDVAAFESFFLQSWDYIYGIAIRLTKSPESAEDLAQEIYIRLWNNRHKLASVENIAAFLYVLSRNMAYDYIRNRVFREENKEELLRYFSRDAIEPDFSTRKEQQEQLQKAIDSLSPQLRQVFVLSHIEGLSHKEVAEKTGISPVSSRVFLARAVAQLRKMLLLFWWCCPFLHFFSARC